MAGGHGMKASATPFVQGSDANCIIGMIFVIDGGQLLLEGQNCRLTPPWFLLSAGKLVGDDGLEPPTSSV